MKDRIAKILSYYNLTSSAFADKIGVQRSGISHILSGRNKPSYDFLVSLLDKFPEINANWLLMGEGDMLETNDTAISYETPVNKDYSIGTKNYDDDEPRDEFINSYKSKQHDDHGKPIEYIMILYKDGSFRRYVSE